MERSNNRKPNELREITIEPNINVHAEGSVLVSFGNTKVICTASIDTNVPRWMRGSDEGWVLLNTGCFLDQQMKEWEERLQEENKVEELKKFKD